MKNSDQTLQESLWDASKTGVLPIEHHSFYLSPIEHRIAFLCRGLQLFKGSDPFYLGLEDLGNLLHTGPDPAGSFLRGLRDCDIIFRAKRGRLGNYSRYFYIAKKDPDIFKEHRTEAKRLKLLSGYVYDYEN